VIVRPTFLYKYTTCAAAGAIIRNSSLKLSIPSAFNDPFDILLEEALGSEVEDFLHELLPAFFEIVSGELDYVTLRPGDFRDKVILLNQQLRDLPADALTARREAWAKQPPEGVWDLKSLRENNKLVVATIQGQFRTYGILCTSANKDSLLMWSHYSDHHRGVVLELRPNVEKQSALLASKPVRYSKERPLMYRSARELIEKALFQSAEDVARSLLQSLIYTKSPEWEYEGEFRLAIPRFVREGAREAYLDFHPEELTRVLFGCRVSDDQRRELEGLARRFNPDVRFSRAIMARREYALKWAEDNAD
jgi:Protein of unknown function (DUF2971)